MTPTGISPPLLLVIVTLWTLPTTTHGQVHPERENQLLPRYRYPKKDLPKRYVYWSSLADKLNCGLGFWDHVKGIYTQHRSDHLVRWGPDKRFFGAFDMETKVITAVGKHPVQFNEAADMESTEILITHGYDLTRFDENVTLTLPSNLLVIAPNGTDGSSEPIFLCLPWKKWNTYYTIGISYNRECYGTRLADGGVEMESDMFYMWTLLDTCKRSELITDVVHYEEECVPPFCEKELRRAKETIREKEAVIQDLEERLQIAERDNRCCCN